MYGMTGYGDAKVSCPCGVFRIEVSSVNHRFRETSVKLPPECSVLEWRIKKYIEGKIRRGKINLYLRWEEKRQDRKVSIDSDLAAGYLKAFRRVARELHLKGDVEMHLLTNLPEVVRVEQVGVEAEKLWPFIEKGVGKACKSLLAMRKKEGRVTQRALNKSLLRIETRLRGIGKRTGKVAGNYTEALWKRVRALGVGGDESRLAQEIAFTVQRMDITEEITRLSGFLEQFSSTVKKGEDIGRKLDFLIQEMNREANTIGSKSNDLSISRSVIDIKAELQKMREQVQNVE